MADSSSSASSDLSNWESDDSGSYLDSDSVIDDQAKAILNPMNLTAAAEGGEETPTPETAAAETAAPETQAPETSPASPETTVPETSAPETQAPETAAPETQAAETAVPEIKASETTAPEPSSAGAAAVQAQEAESSDMITLDPSSGNGLGGNDPAPAVKTEDKILKMLTYRSKP